MALSSADESAVVDGQSGYHFGTTNELKTRQGISYEDDRNKFSVQEQTYEFALPAWKAGHGHGTAPLRSRSSVESCTSIERDPTVSPHAGPASSTPATTPLHAPPKFWAIGNRMPQEEGRRVEYKAWPWEQARMRDVACKVVCSFLNSNGGSLYFGVDDSRIIVGTRASSKQLDEFSQLLNDYFKLDLIHHLTSDYTRLHRIQSTTQTTRFFQ